MLLLENAMVARFRKIRIHVVKKDSAIGKPFEGVVYIAPAQVLLNQVGVPVIVLHYGNRNFMHDMSPLLLLKAASPP